MIKGSVKVTKNNFPSLARQLKGKIADATGETVLDLESEIKQGIVRVGAIDTGAWLNTTQGNHQPAAHDGDVSTGVDHWVYPNYGTATQPARPVVEPAVDIVQPRHEKRIAKAMKP